MTLKEKETRAKTFADYCINEKEMDFDKDSLEFGFIKGLESEQNTNNMKQTKLNPFVRIRGVKGRGAEVIKELEKRGGRDETIFSGEEVDEYHYIHPFTGIITATLDENCTSYFLASYEEISLPRWRAGEGELYYSVIGEGKVVLLKDDRDTSSNLRYAIGNYARTKEELVPYAEKVKEFFKERI